MSLVRPSDLHVGQVAVGTPYACHGPITHIEVYGFGLEHCAVSFRDGYEVHLVRNCPIGAF